MRPLHYDTVESMEVLDEEAHHALQYLEILRLRLRNIYPDGTVSDPYAYETVLRRNFDAVAVLLFEKTEAGFFVFLRHTLRPALGIRQYMVDGKKRGVLRFQEKPVVLEVIAGILEKDEASPEARCQRALAEVWEEGGIRLEAKALCALGAPILPTPGMNPEMIYLLAANLNGQTAQPPPGDGSPIEEVGGLVRYSLAEALSLCLNGTIRDAKTEICLHRFHAWKERL